MESVQQETESKILHLSSVESNLSAPPLEHSAECEHCRKIREPTTCAQDNTIARSSDLSSGMLCDDFEDCGKDLAEPSRNVEASCRKDEETGSDRSSGKLDQAALESDRIGKDRLTVSLSDINSPKPPTNNENNSRAALPVVDKSPSQTAFWVVRAINRLHAISHAKGPKCTDYVFENEGYSMFTRKWGWKFGYLLPGERGHFSDEEGRASSREFPNPELPPAKDGGTWHWVTAWEVDAGSNLCDEKGWVYGRNFHQLSCNPLKASTSWTSVRRRKWCRTREWRGPDSPKGRPHVTADEYRGWLWKLSSTRRRWRRYYFVSTGYSIKWFFNDTSRKIRGEIMTASLPCKVHYLDIKRAQREYAFECVTPDRSLILQADNAQDREDWVCALENGIIWNLSYASNRMEKELVQTFEERRRLCEKASLIIAEMPAVRLAGGADTPSCTQVARAAVEDELVGALCTRFVSRFRSENKRKRAVSEADSWGMIAPYKELSSYRDFLDGMIQRVLDRNMADSSKNDFEIMAEGDWKKSMETALLHALESKIFPQIQDTVYDLLSRSIISDIKIRMIENKAWSAQQPQSWYDIPSECQSPSNWARAVQVINAIEDFSLPSEKHAVILQMAQTIYAVFKDEHENEKQALNGDLFLPIVIYVVSQSSVGDLLTLRDLLSGTLIGKQQVGEIGYYVTIFEAAVSFICDLDQNGTSNRNNSERVRASTLPS